LTGFFPPVGMIVTAGVPGGNQRMAAGSYRPATSAAAGESSGHGGQAGPG
jgi:hypothetical protein